MTEEHEVVIIGSGPAGLTAAIYTGRAALKPLLLEGEPSSTSDQPGGQLMMTTDVENYPGFPDGVMGPELMSKFREQAARFGAQIETVKATKVDFSVRPFRIWTTAEPVDEPNYRAKTVIVSTGAKALMLGLENEERLVGHGVSTCATCDGFFFRDQDIAIVGGGDSAMEEATFLTRFARSVTIIVRRDELRASKIMQERAKNNDKITFMWNSEVSEILGDEALTGLKIKNRLSGETSQLDVTGLFIAIGHVPNTQIFEGQLAMKDNGYLITQAPSARTSVEGVFACGDVQDDIYRQAITASGSGCTAAIDAERWLEAAADVE